MGKHTGKDGVVKAGATPEVVGHVTNWSIDEETDIVQSEATGQTYADQFPTIRRWTGQLDLELDHDDAGQAELVVGDTIAVELYSEGDASGKTYFEGNAVIRSRNRTSPSRGMATMSVQFAGSGALTQSTVA